MSVGREQAGSLMGSLSSLLRTTRAAAQHSTGELGAAGTPLAMLSALRCGPARPSDLAVRLQVAPSVVSRTIVRLEESALVRRVPDPDDARSAQIILTDFGRAKLDQVQGALVDEARTVLDDWSDADVEQAAALLSRLDEAIAGRYSGAAQRLLAQTLVSTVDDAGATPNPAARPLSRV